jgi:AcrR family transcriptional regulator
LISWREHKKNSVTKRIFKESIQLFKVNGFHRTTMQDIALASEVSRATVFNYFASKRAILNKWLNEIIDSYRKYFDHAVLNPVEFDWRFENAMLKVSKELEQNKFFYREVIWEVMNDTAAKYSGWWSNFLPLVQHYVGEWLSHLPQKQQNSEKQLQDSAAEVLSGTFVFTVMNWLISDKDYPLFERLKENFKVVWQGFQFEESRS